MNGQELSAYALTPAPAEAHLIREIKRYSTMLSLEGTRGGVLVYIWQAARKEFRHIGRASNYSDADLVIRAHIRQRRRRRARPQNSLQECMRRYVHCIECARLHRFSQKYCDDCLAQAIAFNTIV